MKPHDTPPMRAVSGEETANFSSPTYPYSDGTYIYFADPDAPTGTTEHMPFKGHRTCAEWGKPCLITAEAA